MGIMYIHALDLSESAAVTIGSVLDMYGTLHVRTCMYYTSPVCALGSWLTFFCGDVIGIMSRANMVYSSFELILFVRISTSGG